MKKLIFVLASCFLSHTASASGLTVVKPLADYTCMALKLSEAQMMDFQNPVSFKARPADDAESVSPASLQVAIKDGAKAVNGYMPTINFAFKPVWISAHYLVPYHAKADPTARCVPSIMSNGKLGFDYPHG